MNIFIDDLIFSLQQAGGISMYWSELMKRMNESISNDVFTCIETENHKNVFADNIHWQQQTIADTSLPLVLKRFLPLQTLLPANSIFHSSYLRWSNQKNVTNILTIHDLAPENKLIAGKGKYIRQWQQRKALQHADGVLCVSETIRRDLLNYYTFLQPEKVKAVYHGVNKSFYTIEKKANKPPFILFVGHRSGYKNFALAVEIVSALPQMHFVIVGGKALSQQELALLHNKLNNRFTFKAVVEMEALNTLYNEAYCLLYPSTYEGFGLPIAEAMKVGCAVVTTNKSAIPEVAGKGALQVDNFSVTSFVQAIQSLENAAVKNELIENGKMQATKFSWDKCFNETIDFYHEIANGKS